MAPNATSAELGAPLNEKTVFVSYAGRDRAWAEWVAWELTAAGYRVVLDSRSWSAGDNFILRINDALKRSYRVVALLSEAYFEPQRYTSIEWTAVLAVGHRLVPLRVEEVAPPPIFGPLIIRDLYGIGEPEARLVLLEAVAGPVHSFGRPSFPRSYAPVGPMDEDGRKPCLPGALPPVWNVPVRNPAFTGRDQMLIRLREQLNKGKTAIVQAVNGMGGVGKTQLAVEYAHRFAGDYELVWWIDAERPHLIGGQLASLGFTTGWIAPDRDLSEAVTITKARLRLIDRWLLIMDNAERPVDVVPWLPEGPGHVIVTSRNPAWSQVADQLKIDVFARAESVILLRRQVPGIDKGAAAELSAALGDLPLAVAQAAETLAATGMATRQYLDLLETHATDVLGEGVPPSYPVSLAAAVLVAVSRLAAEDRAAEQLLQLCAFLAPEPIPVGLFDTVPSRILPKPLSAVVGGSLRMGRCLAAIGRYGLGRITQDGIQLHRLVQAVIRDDLDSDQTELARDRIAEVITAYDPGDWLDPTNWPKWERLLPHIWVAESNRINSPALRFRASNGVRYLIARGASRAALELARDLYARWREQFGPESSDSLRAAIDVARALRNSGKYVEAREINSETLVLCRQVRGDDDSMTLATALSLTVDLRSLGEFEQAHVLAEEVFIRSQRVLGNDHPETLASAISLAANLRALGDFERARQVNEHVLARRAAVLGRDHPDTMISANSLGVDLYALGMYELARQLHEDTLARRRRILGVNHPDSLIAANNLGMDLCALGDFQQARHVHEDTYRRRHDWLGQDHPDTLTSGYNLATSLEGLKDMDAAKNLSGEILTRRRRILGVDHPDTRRSERQSHPTSGLTG